MRQPQVFDEPKPTGTADHGGVDGSPGSLGALRWALSKALLNGIHVHAVGDLRNCPHSK